MDLRRLTSACRTHGRTTVGASRIANILAAYSKFNCIRSMKQHSKCSELLSGRGFQNSGDPDIDQTLWGDYEKDTHKKGAVFTETAMRIYDGMPRTSTRRSPRKKLLSLARIVDLGWYHGSREPLPGIRPWLNQGIYFTFYKDPFYDLRHTYSFIQPYWALWARQ